MQILAENQKNYRTLAGWLKGGRFPHAILIDGAKGTGRKTLAAELAAAVLCTGEEKPCGSCNHCRKVEKGIHPDFMTYSGEGGARSFHISTVRELRQEAWVAPNDGERKVLQLLNTEEMSHQAQNALLKIIEEPPKGVYFILICENQNQMLATIRSRVAVLTTQVIDARSVGEILKKHAPEKSEKEIETAAVMAGGNVGKGLEYLLGEQGGEPYRIAAELWEALKKGSETEALAITARFERDKPGFLLQLELLKNIVSESLRSGKPPQGREPNALQMAQIIDIIEEIASGVNRNVSMLLLTTLLPGKISQAINKI